MPSLRKVREVFERHDPEQIVSTTKFANWVYDMLEALVEAVEPEEHTCGECRFFAPSAAYGCLAEGGLEIHRVWDECPACNKFQPKEPEDTELAEAKAEAANLQVSLNRERRIYKDIHGELCDAKAEIESWMRRCHELERLLAVDKASVADAKIGRLVCELVVKHELDTVAKEC